MFGSHGNEKELDHARILDQLDQRSQEVDDLMARLSRQKRDILALKSELSEAWSKGRCMDPDTLKLLSEPGPKRES